VLDWSVTNRLALGCVGGIVATASAVDGSAESFLDNTSCPGHLPLHHPGLALLTLGEPVVRSLLADGHVGGARRIGRSSLSDPGSVRIAVVPDTPNPNPGLNPPTPTLLTDGIPGDANAIQAPFSWK